VSYVHAVSPQLPRKAATRTRLSADRAVPGPAPDWISPRTARAMVKLNNQRWRPFGREATCNQVGLSWIADKNGIPRRPPEPGIPACVSVTQEGLSVVDLIMDGKYSCFGLAPIPIKMRFWCKEETLPGGTEVNRNTHQRSAARCSRLKSRRARGGLRAETFCCARLHPRSDGQVAQRRKISKKQPQSNAPEAADLPNRRSAVRLCVSPVRKRSRRGDDQLH